MSKKDLNIIPLKISASWYSLKSLTILKLIKTGKLATSLEQMKLVKIQRRKMTKVDFLEIFLYSIRPTFTILLLHLMLWLYYWYYISSLSLSLSLALALALFSNLYFIFQSEFCYCTWCSSSIIGTIFHQLFSHCLLCKLALFNIDYFVNKNSLRKR